MRLKRKLYLVHRYLGIVLCLFMAAWFVSGVVMMYVGYPKLTPMERLEHLPPLDLPSGGLDVRAAINAAGAVGPVNAIKILMAANIPIYLIKNEKDEWTALRADTGERLAPVGPKLALDSAKTFAPGSNPRYMGLVVQDLWTVSRGLDPFRPLHRIALDDDPGGEVYVSERTGEVVRDSTRSERAWNYLGSVTHFLYPFRFGVFDPYWRDIIIGLSLAGTLLAVTGAAIGVMRLRMVRRYPGGGRSPYREPFMRWHHLLGVFFAVVTTAWIFSGLLSMNPWKIFGSPAPTREERIAFSGGALESVRFELSPGDALREIDRDFTAREMVLAVFNGRPFYIFYDEKGRTMLLESRTGASPLSRFASEDIRAAAGRLMPGVAVAGVEELERYDSYYYRRAPHTMMGQWDRRLPMLRVKFGDASNTWFHIDPYTGQVQGKLDASQRVRRWLFSGLHSWDIPVLLNNRPVWDVLMIGFSVGGLALSVTGTVIGWRRLRRSRRERRAVAA